MAENGEKEDDGKDLHEVGTEDDSRRAICTESGDTDLATKDDASDDKYNKLLQEVTELAAKVAEYREKGPGKFAALVERSLAAFRQLPVVDSAPAADSAKEENKFPELTALRVSLTQRLEAATGSLPGLLKDLKDCTSRLDNLIVTLAL